MLKHPTIVRLEQEMDELEARCKTEVAAIQDACPHSLILTTDYHGEVRFCPVCGCEEHAPYYHSFLFKRLKTSPDRLFASKPMSEIVKMRAEVGTKVIHVGATHD